MYLFSVSEMNIPLYTISAGVGNHKLIILLIIVPNDNVQIMN